MPHLLAFVLFSIYKSILDNSLCFTNFKLKFNFIFIFLLCVQLNRDGLAIQSMPEEECTLKHLTLVYCFAHIFKEINPVVFYFFKKDQVFYFTQIFYF